MKVVDDMVIGEISSKPKSGNGVKRGRRGKIEHTREEKELIKSMIREHNEIYKRAEKRGCSLPEERLRCRDIKEELIRMRAI